MTAFGRAWVLVKARPTPFAYHFTDRKNVPGIMRGGLNPALMGSGKGVHPESRPIMDHSMHDFTIEELDEIARNAGYRDTDDLYEGNWTWAMDSHGDTFDDMEMYADMIDDPVMIGIKPDNEGRWVRNWEWAHDQQRTRDRIDPKHLEVIDFAGSRNRAALPEDKQDNRHLLDMMYQRGLYE
jgi:hypothetical protein